MEEYRRYPKPTIVQTDLSFKLMTLQWGKKSTTTQGVFVHRWYSKGEIKVFHV